MKKVIYQFLSLVLVCVAVACTGDEPTDPNNGINPNTPVEDPTGTIYLSMRDYDNGCTYLDHIVIDDENFEGGYFVSVGKVNGLGNITHIPATGWAEKMSVIPGHGYVAYCNGQFYRIYVIKYIESTLGGIIGADIKYQKPFKGVSVDEEIKIDKNLLTLNFEGDGGGAVVPFKNEYIFDFSVSSSAGWCHVERCSTLDYPFLYNGVYIEVEPSSYDEQDKTATVEIKTGYGKTTEIKVTRGDLIPIIELDIEEEGNLSAYVNDYYLQLTTNIPIDILTMESDAAWCQVGDVDYSRSGNYDGGNIDVKFLEGKPVASGSILNYGRSGEVNCYYVKCHVNGNNTNTERSANITISYEDKESQSLKITQDEGWLFYDYGQDLGPYEYDGNLRGVYSVNFLTTIENLDEIEFECDADWFGFAIEGYDYYGGIRGTLRLENMQQNSKASERSATIYMRAKNGTLMDSIKVKQNGVSLVANKELITFDKNSSNETVSISCYIDYTPISSDESWLTFSKNGNNLTIRATPTDKEREGTITFEGGFDAVIKVVQSKYAVGDAYNENGVEGTVGYIKDGYRVIYKEVGNEVWSTETVITGANSFIDGEYNTSIIKSIPTWQQLYPAYALVDALNVNGITGWYMPAKNELNKVGLKNYWSSTEYNSNYAYMDNTSFWKSSSVRVVSFRKF